MYSYIVIRMLYKDVTKVEHSITFGLKVRSKWQTGGQTDVVTLCNTPCLLTKDLIIKFSYLILHRVILSTYEKQLDVTRHCWDHDRRLQYSSKYRNHSTKHRWWLRCVCFPPSCIRTSHQLRKQCLQHILPYVWPNRFSKFPNLLHTVVSVLSCNLSELVRHSLRSKLLDILQLFQKWKLHNNKCVLGSVETCY